MKTTKDNLQVIYEDNHIIVINKRAGDIVQGDKTGDEPLSEIIKSFLVRHSDNNIILYIYKNIIKKERHIWGSFIG